MTAREFTMQTLQTESNEWVIRNFAPRPSYQPVFGIVEELGELAEAETLDDVIDAAADVMVYSADVCNAFELSMQTVWDQAHLQNTPFVIPPIVFAGRLSHAVLKLEQGIRGDRAHHVRHIEAQLVLIVFHLLRVGNTHGFNLLEQTGVVWDKVRARRWRCATCGVKFMKHQKTEFCPEHSPAAQTPAA